MEVFLGIFIVIGGILLIAFLRSLTTLFHELGHAFPALIFSEKEVTVYVGSYGDISNTLKFAIGRLKVFLKFNLFDWKMGMCSHAPVRNVWKELIIIIGGPISSLIIAAVFLYFIIKGGLSDNWIFVSAAFMMAAAIDFATNIIPSENPISFHDNSIGYNDGQQLTLLVSRYGLPDAFFEAERFFYEKKYEEAKGICEELLKKTKPSKAVLKLAIEILVAKKDYVGALEQFGDLQQIKKLSSSDYFLIGFLYKKLNQPETAIQHLNKSIYLKYENPKALNQRGDLYMSEGNLEVAERDFKAAIHYAPTFGEAYRNLGMLFLKKRDLQAAFENFLNAEKKSPEDAFIYYGLGLLFEEKKDLNQALKYFKKAEKMKIDHHAVRFKIASIENELGI